MEEKIIIETIPALTTIEEATSSFSLIAWFNTVQGSIGIDNQLSAARKEPTTETLKTTAKSANESDKV